ncbi:MAG: YraN family protein [Gaiellaceae bacterium]
MRARRLHHAGARGSSPPARAERGAPALVPGSLLRGAALRPLRLPGARAERQALRHYRLRGYRILAANRRIGGVEVDLICRRGRSIVFCEVKEKRSDGLGDPLEMVDGRKQERLRRAAEAWLASAGDPQLELRFDVVAVRPDGLERVEAAF